MNEPKKPLVSSEARARLEAGFQSMRESAIDASPQLALQEFTAIRAQSDGLTAACRQRLFESGLMPDEAESGAARWTCTQHHRLARLAKRIAESLARGCGADADLTLRAIALSLHYMAESVKGEISVGLQDSHHYGRVHALMRMAIGGGRHRDAVEMQIDGIPVRCTIESLYLRTLLLSRISRGGLTLRQLEIFDVWLRDSFDVLAGVDTAPPGGCWRADLDSANGLRSGPRQDHGPALYLPLAALDRRYRDITAQFHAGRVVPAQGPASAFPIEDHVAVLDLVRRTLRQSRRGPVARSHREPCNASVELSVGLGQIIAKAFAPASASGNEPLLAEMQSGRNVERREIPRATALADVYSPVRRILQLVNVSDTGLALEGPESACEDISPGELVTARMPDGTLALGKVVRRAASSDGRAIIGVKRISASARIVRCTPVDGRRDVVSFLFVPGRDSSGCNDAYLASESAAIDRRTFETCASGETFTFRLNRVREQGRGWILAGFEVLGVARSAQQALH